MTNAPDRREAALDWLVRTNDPDFDSWGEFTSWLEEDAANAEAYHALAVSEAELRPLVADAVTVEIPAAKPRQRRLALVAGVAALAAAATAVVAPRLMPVGYETAPGETQVVSLGGEDRLVMNGGTRVELAGLDRRTVRLLDGQVLLAMHEPDQEPIEVLSGDLRLVDVGTVFEVARNGGETRVLVSEGAVVADPQGAALVLSAGQRLDTHDGAAVLAAAPADVSAVGGFVRGQLTYVDEPVANVVADLKRSTGIDFSAGTAMEARRFTGTLSVGEVKRDPRSLEPLLGARLERQPNQGWRIERRV